MDKARFTEMTDRSRLASECHDLRGQLKAWERDFAEHNSGRKPGKEDIKKNPKVATKYKVYNRKKDVLDGKKDVEPSSTRSPSVRRPKSISSVKATDQNQCLPRGKSQPFATPRKTQVPLGEIHPCVLDPYDAPFASVSPHPYLFKNAIGPTPQRDGKTLGLFDLLSSGSGSTPSRKRKADALGRIGGGMNPAQTPSKRHVRGACDVLDHLAADSGGRRHSRTPASDGKRFMLSQFFATPSTMRFASVAEEGQEDDTESAAVAHTPLRTRVLTRPEQGSVEKLDAADNTPTFLKRTTSFNQRLRNAFRPNGEPASAAADLAFTSPGATRKGPLTRLFKGKPLSEILRELRQMEDEDDEDELDALREMEQHEADALVVDSQNVVTSGDVAEEPVRTWKKKGQKRTTRRVKMRPVEAPMKASTRKSQAAQSDGSEHEADITRVEETQMLALVAEADEVNPYSQRRLCKDEDDNKENDVNSDSPTTENELEDPALDSDFDELAMLRPQPSLKKRKPATALADTADVKSRKSSCQAPTKGKEKQEKRKKGINPNALSHMNFRSLKIRNKNSKGKGKGRFGRGKR